MTSMIQRLRQDALQARKTAVQNGTAEAQVAATLLVTLLSEAAMVGKNDGGREPTDAEVIKIVGKFVKGADESLVVLLARADAQADPRVSQLQVEKRILDAYLPQQLTEAALAAEIAGIVAGLTDKGPKAMGGVMKALKDQFAGRYDGTLAGKLVKDALT